MSRLSLELNTLLNLAVTDASVELVGEIRKLVAEELREANERGYKNGAIDMRNLIEERIERLTPADLEETT